MNGTQMWKPSARAVRGIAILQSQKVSHPSNIPNRFYVAPKLKNWMYELCKFSQIQSHIANYSRWKSFAVAKLNATKHSQMDGS